MIKREGSIPVDEKAAHDLVDDPQAIAGRGFVDMPLPDGTTARMVATPVDFGGQSSQIGQPVPELGQHTELVLLELGHSWEEISALRVAGVIS